MWLLPCVTATHAHEHRTLHGLEHSESYQERRADGCGSRNLCSTKSRYVDGCRRNLGVTASSAEITRKWRELRAVSSYLFLVGWRSAFGAQSNAKRTTSSLDDIGWNTIIAPDSAHRQISKPLESVVRKWSNRQTTGR